MKAEKRKQSTTPDAIGSSSELAMAFNASCCDQTDEAVQHHYVPLPPTETGRKRHAAHQLKAPKFAQETVTCKQSQHTELYLG